MRTLVNSFVRSTLRQESNHKWKWATIAKLNVCQSDSFAVIGHDMAIFACIK